MILRQHRNVRDVTRTDDIVFEICRNEPDDELRILCIDEYACSELDVRRALEEFGHLDVIYIGGKWNHYTAEAAEFCAEQEIGIGNAGEINQILRKRDVWK